jgi:hypothetical protein
MGDFQPETDESPPLRLRRAHLLIRVGRSSQTDAELSHALQLAPEDMGIAHDLAITRLLAGDLPGYRSVCATMLRRVASQATSRQINPRSDRPASDAVARVFDAAIWSPDAVTDLATLKQAVDPPANAVTGSGTLREVIDPSARWDGRNAAAILYRAGLYREALYGPPPPEQSALDWLFLAMIHSRLGDVRQARHILAIADQWISEADRSPRSSESKSDRPQWRNRIEQHTTRLLRSEAEVEVLYDPVFPADPFAH